MKAKREKRDGKKPSLMLNALTNINSYVILISIVVTIKISFSIVFNVNL